ncbi:sugar ABC transporter substrate-binding protein [Cryptosporangium aurantiacum]|uniref:Ribose transport system substrate-binding protein n=1 Tax=Cryptosporangium aurantiacum TaxID=134849 RepID=A0A1M7R6X7_9ACTN|nr:substrate-binding domain-containing protein [Cryptosporangium aurantiacum]SHN41879.1 ribose transport system substrate-binding protein [Cryptosporangium aurantiacum]
MARYSRVARCGVALLTAASLAAAAACSDSGGGSGGTKKMSFVVANISLNFALEMANGGKFAAEEAGGIDLKVVGPATTDGPQEVQMFQNTITTNRDGAVVENLAPDLFTRPYAQAVDKGIPIVALDTVPLDGSKVELYVGNDNYELGTQLADEAIKRLPKDAKGTIVLGVPNPGVPVLDMRANGIRDTFAKKLPGVTVKGPFQTFSDPGQSYNAWSSQVRANRNALAFLGVGDADSYSLARLKKETGGKWLSGGFDLDAKTLEAVKDGTNFVTISPEHYLKGYVAMRLLAEAVKDGKELPKGWFYTPGLIVDSSNIDAIIARQASDQARRDGIADEAKKLFADTDAYLRPLKDAR